jgi:UDP-N-acetyl-D-mannosaminuronic acid transferase (WecB/TagA/CpsF family)
MIQNIGLEWLFRIVQEPLTVGPHYLRLTTCANIIVKQLHARFFASGRLIGLCRQE